MIVLLNMEGEERMKELYIVRDVPQYEEECSNYCYVVRAESHAEAIDIVRKNAKCQWDLEAELADNKEVWEQIIGFMERLEVNKWKHTFLRGFLPRQDVIWLVHTAMLSKTEEIWMIKHIQELIKSF